jgi:hypothetical protein
MSALGNWQPLMEALGWTLIHFTWQGTLVALLLAGILQILRRSSTNSRYLAACAALLLMSALPLITMAHIILDSPNRTATGLSPLLAARQVSLPQPIETESIIVPAQTDIATASPRLWTSIRSVNIEPLLPWVILLWLLGVGFSSLRLVGGWFYTQRLKFVGTPSLEDQ